jgi:pSer/pThr/pTyr-binding forkhead associated (FHA) protein/DNA-directed RNA polymerase subunit RPC12/RpoP
MDDKKERIIGREGDIPVPGTYTGVSRRHAKITKEADGLYIEDLGSTGGTYVNGKPVRKKKISPKDRVVLGTDYVLDVGEALAQIPMSDAEFTEDFCKLKEVYATYNRTRVHIQSQSQGKMMTKRSIPMAAPGLLMAGISLLSGSGSANDNGHYKLILMITGFVLSAVAMIGGSIWGAKEMEKTPERLSALEEAFKIDYSCPDCKRPFGQTPWESLRRQGQCPYCRRKFNVKS